jgi:hypothetical protein
MITFREYIINESIVGKLRKIRDLFAKSPSYSFASLVDADFIDNDKDMKYLKIKYFEKDFENNIVNILDENLKIIDTYPLSDVLKAISKYYSIDSDEAKPKEEVIKETERTVFNRKKIKEFADKYKNKIIRNKEDCTIYSIKDKTPLKIKTDTELLLIDQPKNTWYDYDYIVEYSGDLFTVSPWDIFIKGIKPYTYRG